VSPANNFAWQISAAHDTFLGTGIGNFCLEVTATTGWGSAAIEVERSRPTTAGIALGNLLLKLQGTVVAVDASAIDAALANTEHAGGIGIGEPPGSSLCDLRLVAQMRCYWAS
jgi:hypothetical protein